jgi:hypothetical protein
MYSHVCLNILNHQWPKNTRSISRSALEMPCSGKGHAVEALRGQRELTSLSLAWNPSQKLLLETPGGLLGRSLTSVSLVTVCAPRFHQIYPNIIKLCTPPATKQITQDWTWIDHITTADYLPRLSIPSSRCTGWDGWVTSSAWYNPHEGQLQRWSDSIRQIVWFKGSIVNPFPQSFYPYFYPMDPFLQMDPIWIQYGYLW